MDQAGRGARPRLQTISKLPVGPTRVQRENRDNSKSKIDQLFEGHHDNTLFFFYSISDIFVNNYPERRSDHGLFYWKTQTRMDSSRTFPSGPIIFEWTPLHQQWEYNHLRFRMLYKKMRQPEIVCFWWTKSCNPGKAETHWPATLVLGQCRLYSMHNQV